MTLPGFLTAALLALFLTMPTGPVGFVAAERLMRGFGRDFRLTAVGCVTATMGLVLAALLILTLLPEFDGAVLERMGWLWTVPGIVLVALGSYLWRQLPKRSRGRKPRAHPFLFGFGVTLLWPTNLPSMIGVFMGLQAYGMLSPDLGVRLMVVPGLGVLAAFLWLLWAWGCLKLRAQKRWTLEQLAMVFHRCMAGSVVLGGVLLILKPLGF